MAIKVVLPDAFAPLELGDVLTALAFGGVISGVTATQVNGNVIYGSVIASFQYLARRVMTRSAGQIAAGVAAGAAQVETLERRAVAGVPGDRAHVEELIKAAR